MKIKSFNEWDPLKSVLVGTATNANFPKYDQLFQLQMSEAGWTETPPPAGPVPQHIIEETNEDLDILANTLTDLGIEVHRPAYRDIAFYDELNCGTPDWQTDGQYAYCPRDNLLIVGDRVIEAPMSTRARTHEVNAFDRLRREAIADGARWFAAPRPRLLGHENGLYTLERKPNDFVPHFELNELEPVFDAANVCRFGLDLLYLKSSTANKAGADWLQRMLGPHFTVHVTDVYNAAHIDSTIVPIEYNYVVLNANRVTEDNLPYFLKDWKKIWITEDMINPQGFEGYPYASKWIAINMLALGNFRVICDKNQPKIIAELEKNGFEVIPLELRHARTLGGGFHCVTLDLERQV